MASVRVRPMTTDDARQVAGWRCLDRRSAAGFQSSTDVSNALELYLAVADNDDKVIGFIGVDSAAGLGRLDPDPDILDVEIGIDPCLAGHGSEQVIGEAILDHLGRTYTGRPLRALIQSSNMPGRRFASALGFIDVGELSNPQGAHQNSCRVLLKPEARSSWGTLVAQSGIWLFGDEVMLREFAAVDQQAVHAYASDPAVTTFTVWGPNSATDTDTFLADAAAQSRGAARSEFTLAAVHITSGKLIGSGAISVTNAHHGRGEIGYVINREFWSQGYATEVAQLLVQFGFQHLRLRRIEATCHPDNRASARVLQKAGLTFEGLMRSHLLVDGVGRDSLLYAIVGN